jgi:hypothetical protein
MALSIEQINAISTAVYDKTLTQQVYDENPLLKKLRDSEKMTIAGGDDIRFPVRVKRLGTGGDVSWDDQVTPQAIDTRTSGVLEWAVYRANTMLRWEEKAKAQEGKQRIVNIVEEKTTELAEEMRYRLATDLFATSFTDTNKIVPIPTIVDSADSYAGIAVADTDDSSWASGEDASSTKMTRALLYADIEGAKFGSDMPNFFITTRALAGSYNALLGADERYVNTKEANAGFVGPSLYGYPVIGDPYVSSGDFFGLDLKALELFVMKGQDMTTSEWIDLAPAGYPDSAYKIVKSVCNLVSRRRRTHFKLTALTGT